MSHSCKHCHKVHSFHSSGWQKNTRSHLFLRLHDTMQWDSIFSSAFCCGHYPFIFLITLPPVHVNNVISVSCWIIQHHRKAVGSVTEVVPWRHCPLTAPVPILHTPHLRQQCPRYTSGIWGLSRGNIWPPCTKQPQPNASSCSLSSCCSILLRWTCPMPAACRKNVSELPATQSSV